MPLVVHHVHHLVHVEPALPVHVPRTWHWLTNRIRPLLTLGTAVLVVGPWFDGHSITGQWSHTLNQARDASIAGAYVLAGIGLGIALLTERAAGPTSRRGHQLAARALLIVTTIGGTGALGWYDPITILTGVHP